MYRILQPHPILREKFKKAGIGMNSKESAAINTERMFFYQCGEPVYADGANVADPKQAGNFIIGAEDKSEAPIKREITNVFRIRNAKGEEYIYYDEHFIGRDFLKNKRTHSRRVGKYNDVEFQHSVSKQGRVQIEPWNIEVDKEPTYEIPLTLEKEVTDPSTGDKVKLMDLDQLMNEYTGFFVQTGTRKYGLTGVTYEQFLTKPFADLVEYGRTGKWPAVLVGESLKVKK